MQYYTCAHGCVYICLHASLLLTLQVAKCTHLYSKHSELIYQITVHACIQHAVIFMLILSLSHYHLCYAFISMYSHSWQIFALENIL